MFGLSTIKLVLLGLAALAIVSALGAGALYVQHLQNALVLAEKDNATLAAAKAMQDDTIRQQTDQAARFAAQVRREQEANTALARSNAEAQVTINRLADTLAKHDLRKIANAKPGPLARRLNDGTRRALDGLRDASTPHRDDKGGRASSAAPIPSAEAGRP